MCVQHSCWRLCSALNAFARDQVRPLSGEGEVEQWLDFVSNCFAFKGVQRRHFASHFWSDPWRDARKILVAETSSDAAEQVATLRIFDRRLYLKEGVIQRVGGIGEVSICGAHVFPLRA